MFYRIKQSYSRKKPFYSNWTVRKQIFLVQLVFGFLTIAILIVITLPVFNYVMEKYLSFSKQIYVDEFYRNSDNLMYLQIRNAKEVIQRSQRHLIKADILYQFMQTVQMKYIQQPYECLTNYEDVDVFQYQQTFCYGYFGDYEYQETEADLLAKNYSSMLTQVMPMLDLDLDLLFSTIGDQMYFSIWPGDPFQNYHPHRRIWYMNHLEQIANGNYNLTYFSDPYILWTWHLFMITQTRNMTNNGLLAGVLGSDLNFSLFNTFQKQYASHEFQIIDLSGTLLLSQLNVSDVVQIYDESLTGISEKSFDQIKNSLEGLPFENDCGEIDLFYDPSRLCRYNTLSHTDVLIEAQIFQQPNLVIVIQSDLLYKKKELDEQFIVFRNSIQNQIDFYVYGCAILCLISILFGLVSICIIFQHITKLIHFTTQQIYREQDIMKHQLFQKIYLGSASKISSAITELHEAYLNMQSSLTKFIESIKHPMKGQEKLQLAINKVGNIHIPCTQLNVLQMLQLAHLMRSRRQ